MSKLVYVVPSLSNPDGVERVLISQANYMADIVGHSVYIVLSEPVKENGYSYSLSPKVSIFNLRIGFYERRSSSLCLKELVTYFRKLLVFKSSLSKILCEIKPDVTISLLYRELNFINSINDGSRKIGWAHLNLGSYRKVNFGPYRLRPILTKVWQYLFFNQLKSLDTLVVLTNEDKDNWQTKLNNIVVIPDPLSFETDKRSDLTAKRVLSIGRYAYQKGFDRLLRIWSDIYKDFPDWELHIYGRGNRDNLQKLSDNLGISESCFLHGFEKDVEKLYLSSSIYAFPSRYEGFGLVLTEAMQCGLPCVSFNCPCGPKDIIVDGETGFLVYKDEDFKNRLCLLMKDKDLRAGMGAKSKVESFIYKNDKIMNRWHNLFVTY